MEGDATIISLLNFTEYNGYSSGTPLVIPAAHQLTRRNWMVFANWRDSFL